MSERASAPRHPGAHPRGARLSLLPRRRRARRDRRLRAQRLRRSLPPRVLGRVPGALRRLRRPRLRVAPLAREVSAAGYVLRLARLVVAAALFPAAPRARDRARGARRQRIARHSRSTTRRSSTRGGARARTRRRLHRPSSRCWAASRDSSRSSSSSYRRRRLAASRSDPRRGRPGRRRSWRSSSSPTRGRRLRPDPRRLPPRSRLQLHEARRARPPLGGRVARARRRRRPDRRSSGSGRAPARRRHAPEWTAPRRTRPASARASTRRSSVLTAGTPSRARDRRLRPARLRRALPPRVLGGVRPELRRLRRLLMPPVSSRCAWPQTRRQPASAVTAGEKPSTTATSRPRR